MATEKLPSENLNLEGKYSILEALDLQITELNEEFTYLGADNKSVLSHLRNIVTKLKALDAGNFYQGVINCSGNPNYPAAYKDQYWRVSVAGKIGGASGTLVDIGDMIICIEDAAAGGTEAAVGDHYMIIEHNINRPYLIAAEDAYTTAVDDNVAGLSSSITLVNQIKARINSHFADAGSTTLNACIALANETKTNLNLHFQDEGGAGEEHKAMTELITTANATSLVSLIALITELITDYNAHDTDAKAASPVLHQAQYPGSDLASSTPPTDLHECITLLTDMKAKINLHIANGTAHSNGDNDQMALADPVYVEEHIAAFTPILGDDATDLASAKSLCGTMLVSYNSHEKDSEAASGWTYHVGQETGDASLASVATPTTLALLITRLNDLKAKFNTHVADTANHTNADSTTVSATDAANGAAIDVTVAGAVSGDYVNWAVLYGGSSNRTGVSAVAGTNKVTFTFSGDPGTTAIISYAVHRPATT